MSYDDRVSGTRDVMKRMFVGTPYWRPWGRVDPPDPLGARIGGVTTFVVRIYSPGTTRQGALLLHLRGALMSGWGLFAGTALLLLACVSVPSPGSWLATVPIGYLALALWLHTQTRSTRRQVRQASWRIHREPVPELFEAVVDRLVDMETLRENPMQHELAWHQVYDLLERDTNVHPHTGWK